MTIIKKYWFFIILIIFFASGNAFQFFNPTIKTVKVETTTVIKDTSQTLQLRAKTAEITYLKNELNNARGEIEYKLDTLYLPGADKPVKTIIPSFIAKFDTSYNQGKDSVHVDYHYPENKFNFLHRYTYNQSFTENKITLRRPLFEFTHGIIAGAFVDPLGQVRVGIGYGFQIKINYPRRD